MLDHALYYLDAHSTSSRPIEEPGSHLLAKAIEGDHFAFAQLVQQHGKMVRQMAFRIAKSYDDAEDVVQESLLRAYKNLHTFKGEAKFSTWLSRITINTALMHLRKKRRLNETSIDVTVQEELLSSLGRIVQIRQ